MASKSLRFTNETAGAGGDVAPRPPAAGAPPPPHQAVAARAYDKFIGRGGAHGLDQQDWVEAEGELAAERRDRRAPEDGLSSGAAGTGQRGGETSTLHGLKDLEHFMVRASDGDIGDVVDFLIDDQSWTVRYMVVDAGTFFDGRRVLISPNAFREVDWSSHKVNLDLTKEKVRSAPPVDTDLPVSRQNERAYHDYYGYPYYWGAGFGWGMGASYPGMLGGAAVNAAASNGRPHEPSGDAHLRSVKELRGYHIQGTDDGIGHVKDFIVDDRTWGIRYLVVDTSNWWFGKKIILAPHWASRVSWGDRKVFVDLTRDAIKDSPAWKGIDALNRQYEVELHSHYGLTPYWLHEDPGFRTRSLGPR